MRRNSVAFLSIVAIMLCTAVMLAQEPRTSNDQKGTQQASKTIIDPGLIYNDKSPTSWVGKSVTLKNVTVQDTNNSGNFWVGSDDDHRLLIVKPSQNANLNALQVHKGDIVTISGMVRPASDYMASQTSAEKGSMDDAKNSSGVFLMADHINISSSTSR